MTKRFKYCEEPNGEFPYPYIKRDDGKNILSLYACCELLNEFSDENNELKFLIQQLHRAMSRQEVRYKQLQESYEELLRNNPMPTNTLEHDV